MPRKTHAQNQSVDLANAGKCTGPRTPQGKRRSARNALKHALLSREVVIGTGNGAVVRKRGIRVTDRVRDSLAFQGVVVAEGFGQVLENVGGGHGDAAEFLGGEVARQAV